MASGWNTIVEIPARSRSPAQQSASWPASPGLPPRAPATPQNIQNRAVSSGREESLGSVDIRRDVPSSSEPSLRPLLGSTHVTPIITAVGNADGGYLFPRASHALSSPIVAFANTPNEAPEAQPFHVPSQAASSSTTGVVERSPFLAPTVTEVTAAVGQPPSRTAPPLAGTTPSAAGAPRFSVVHNRTEYVGADAAPLVHQQVVPQILTSSSSAQPQHIQAVASPSSPPRAPQHELTLSQPRSSHPAPWVVTSHWAPAQHTDASLLTDATIINNRSASVLPDMSIANAGSNARLPEVDELHRQLQNRNDEIMRLRSSLVVALQCYAYTPNGLPDETDPNHTLHASERQFLSAVSHAIADPNEAPTLIVDRAPPHVQGLPNVPLPLDINTVMGQFHGYLDMLETTDRTLFKKSWKARYVVADQHGVTVFRDDADYKAFAFHKAILTIPYHCLEYFVPSFRDPSIPAMLEAVAAQDDVVTSSLQQMMAMSQQHATERRYGYFGFIAKLARGVKASGGPPQIMFRTASSLEHSDWAHFLAKCFNLRLYRTMFPMMLAESLFGLLSKSSQTEPAPCAAADVQVGDSDWAEMETMEAERKRALEAEAAALFSPPPPPPPGAPPEDGGALTTVDANAPGGEALFPPEPYVPQFADIGTSPDTAGRRVAAAQTDDLAEWIASAPTTSSVVASDESVSLQRHIAALQEQCDTLRGEVQYLKLERDSAVDHCAAVMGSLHVAEGEVRRLRQEVVDGQNRAMELVREASEETRQSTVTQAEVMRALTDERNALESEVAALKAELQSKVAAMDEAEVSAAERIRALAEKAASDVEILRDKMLQAEVPVVPHHNESVEFSPFTAAAGHHTATAAEGEEFMGSLDMFTNTVGDVRFHLNLSHQHVFIEMVKESQELLKKKWFLRTATDDGEIEISAALQWSGEGDSNVDSVMADEVHFYSGDGGVEEDAEDAEALRRLPPPPPNVLRNVTPVGSSNNSARNVREESSQSLLARLQAIPTAVMGRVGLNQPPPNRVRKPSADSRHR